MRRCATLAVLLLCIDSIAQTKKIVESKIEKVTVFLQGAQTERSSKFTIGPGKTELVFTNISPLIDKQSIQVKPVGNITVLSVSHQRNFLKEQQKQDEIKEVETSKEGKWMDYIDVLKDKTLKRLLCDEEFCDFYRYNY